MVELDLPLDNVVGEVAPPIAEPAVVAASGNNNTDAAGLLAAGGPGDPALPGWDNVGRSSSGNASVVYLGSGWAITASHVSISSSGVQFGGQTYPVDVSSIQQLSNSDGSLADLKMFKLVGDPGLPDIFPSMITQTTPSGHVFMIGNGLGLGDQFYWHVDTTQNPWVWTEQSPPVFPGPTDVTGFGTTSQHTIRWGENNVDQAGLFLQVGSNVFIHGFSTQFDNLKYTGQAALTNEAQATSGDSGGAVFSFVGGQWQLAGLMVAVSAPLNGEPADTFIAGSQTFIADLSVYREQIQSIIGPTVVERHLFYNQSAFDGNDPLANAADDGAIDPTKTAYLPGSGSSTTQNVSSFSRGINGIMVDVALPAGALTAADFTFRVGQNNAPETWVDAPAPTTVLVRPGAGVGGSDRVEIVWPNNAIQDKWLQVTVEGNDATGGFNTNTGLPGSDVFYFGNRTGDTGLLSSPVAAVTNASDEIQARSNGAAGVAVDNIYDFNHDGFVNATDQIIARVNGGILPLINLATETTAPTAQPAAATAEPLQVEHHNSRPEHRSVRQLLLLVPQSTSLLVQSNPLPHVVDEILGAKHRTRTGHPSPTCHFDAGEVLRRTARPPPPKC